MPQTNLWVSFTHFMSLTLQTLTIPVIILSSTAFIVSTYLFPEGLTKKSCVPLLQKLCKSSQLKPSMPDGESAICISQSLNNRRPSEGKTSLTTTAYLTIWEMICSWECCLSPYCSPNPNFSPEIWLVDRNVDPRTHPIDLVNYIKKKQ